MEFYALILAAGKGTRMKDEAMPAEFPKVLRQVCGRPMIDYVIGALKSSDISDINIIVGFGADYVREALGENWTYIIQDKQMGSGHAVLCAKDALGSRKGYVIVMCGDSPLFTSKTLSELKEKHASSGAAITMVSAFLDNPTGYGRIKRNEFDAITGVVEEKCASVDEKSIQEINGGAYVFDSEWLWDNIELMQRNEAGELNLTDMVRVAVSQGRKVEAVKAGQEEVMGANSPTDLLKLEEILCNRKQ